MTVMKSAACVVAIAYRSSHQLLTPRQAERHHDHRGPASIAREVGGDRVTVESIARGYQDPHFVEAKPSFILKLQKADLLVVGRSWRSAGCRRCIQQSRNAKSGRARLSGCVAQRASRIHGPDHARDGRRPPAGKPALLAGSGERQAIRQGDRDKLSQLRRTTGVLQQQRRFDA
jgi:hypothetical protein